MSALREVFARFSTQFDGAALARGDRQVQGLTNRFGGILSGVRAFGAAVAGLAIVQTIRGWIGAVQDFASEMAALGDELDKTSKVIGISSGDIQSWRHAANLSGVGAEQFTQALIRLQSNMRTSMITPTSNAALAFDRLGVSLTDSNGELRDVSDVLMDMADPLQQLTSDSERVALMTALAGRSGARMGPLFAQGRAGVEEMRNELERLGGGATPEMIQAAADWTDANARLDLSILSIKSRLAVALLPVMESGIQAVTSLTSWLARNEEVVTLLKVAFIALAGVVTVLTINLALITLPIWLTLTVILAVVVVALGAVILIVQDLIVWFEGGNSVIGTFIESMLALAGISLEDVRQEWRELQDTITRAYNAVAGAIGLPTIDGEGDTPPPASSLAKAEGVNDDPRGGRGASGYEGTPLLARLRSVLDEGRPSSSPRDTVRGRTERELRAQNVSQAFTFNVTGENPVAIAREVERRMDRANRDAAEALGQ